MHSFDRALQLTPVEPGVWQAVFIKEWDRGDRLAQGGYTNAYCLKACLVAAPNYPHPVSLTVHYLDVIHIGVACEFHVRIRRQGKRYAYLNLELRQGGRTAILALCVLASDAADVYTDNGGGSSTDLSVPSYQPPKVSKDEWIPMPQDLFGDRPRKEDGKNAEDAAPRGGMWQHMHRLMRASDVAKIRAWKSWRDRKTRADACGAEFREPEPSRGTELPTTGLVSLVESQTENEYGSVSLSSRAYDALACCLWVDNFPPFSMLAWRDPKLKPGQGKGMMPGWTTVQLTTEWVRACEKENGGF